MQDMVSMYSVDLRSNIVVTRIATQTNKITNDVLCQSGNDDEIPHTKHIRKTKQKVWEKVIFLIFLHCNRFQICFTEPCKISPGTV